MIDIVTFLTAAITVAVVHGATSSLGRRPRRPVAPGGQPAGPSRVGPRRRWASRSPGSRSLRWWCGVSFALAPAAIVAGPTIAGIAALTVIAARLLRARRAERRAQAEREALVPELIELILVAIHAGLTPANAVLRLGATVPEPLVAALTAVGQRVRSGDRFADALAELPRLAGHPFGALAGAIALAERTGDPIAPVLDRLAEEARRHRRRLADTAARELPVRLSVPLVCCTLPAFVLLAIVPVLAGTFSSLRDAVP